MKYLLSFYFFVHSISCFSQDWPSQEFINKFNYKEVLGDTTGLGKLPDKLKPAMYPNGKEGIYILIKNETKFPNTETNLNNKGRVILSYVVDSKGKVDDIRVIQSAGKIFDKEAIRVIKKMHRWIPATLDNRIVRVKYTQSFSFD
jgi:TonB family protein